MKKVWVYITHSTRIVGVFSSKARLLQYFKEQYPKKERLRLSAQCYITGGYTLLNHTTPVHPHGHILDVEIDNMQLELRW